VSFIGGRQRLTITGAADRPIVVEAPNSLAVEAGQRVGLGIEPARFGCCRKIVVMPRI
jgi:putative spermidine/putrescine transport system ATP-binding protein